MPILLISKFYGNVKMSLKKRLLIRYDNSPMFRDGLMLSLPSLSELFEITLILQSSYVFDDMIFSINNHVDKGYLKEFYVLPPSGAHIFRFAQAIKKISKKLKEQAFDIMLCSDDVNDSHYICKKYLCVPKTKTFVYIPSCDAFPVKDKKLIEEYGGRKKPYLKNTYLKRKKKDIINERFKNLGSLRFFLWALLMFSNTYFLPHFKRIKSKIKNIKTWIFWFIEDKRVNNRLEMIHMLNSISQESDSIPIFLNHAHKIFNENMLGRKCYVVKHPLELLSEENKKLEASSKIPICILSAGMCGSDNLPPKDLDRFIRAITFCVNRVKSDQVEIRTHPKEKYRWANNLASELKKRGINANVTTGGSPLIDVLRRASIWCGILSTSLCDGSYYSDSLEVIGFSMLSNKKTPGTEVHSGYWFGSVKNIKWLDEDKLNFDDLDIDSSKENERRDLKDLLNELG